MTREDIIAQVNSLLAEEFEVGSSSIDPQAEIKEVLHLDSLSLVDLVALIQQTYKVKIPITELQRIQTFNDLYDYIEQHLPIQ